MSTSSDTRLRFEGVLEKAGKRFFEGFRKRWFTLDGQDLTYFKAPEKTEENYLGTIDFGQVKAVNPIKMVNNGFQILTKNRTYTFSAPTPELLTEWLSVLRQAMQLQSFEKRNSRLSSQDSLDSQYEEVVNRKPRSLSSDHSLDEDVTYCCISEPNARQNPDEYSLVGAVTLPRAAKNNDNTEMYELVGSRPPSKSAPPTYEMVQSAKKRSKEIYDAIYDMIPGPDDQQEPTKQLGGDAMGPSNEKGTDPQTEMRAVENQPDASDVNPVYSTVPKKRKQNLSVRGLSMISESESEEAQEAPPSPSSEEIVPPLPSKPALGQDAFAIYEIKRFLEETAKEDEESAINNEGEETNDGEGDAVTAQAGSAFQQLKAFLQKLDSLEGK